jgi:hypothetical protein
MNQVRKWFSLMELLLVIVIILILFLASKSLFQTPNKYLIDSESCINRVQWNISQFFYQGISGKDKTINGITYQPDTYAIQIKKDTWYNEIWLYISTWANYLLDSKMTITQTGSTIPWCNTNLYNVILSWSQLSSNNNNITILINKNLNNTLWEAGMRICQNYDINIPNTCTSAFSSKIYFLVCKKTSSTNTIDMSTCKHTYSSRFDTATQSVKTNRCLNILYDQPCRKRSVENF